MRGILEANLKPSVTQPASAHKITTRRHRVTSRARDSCTANRSWLPATEHVPPPKYANQRGTWTVLNHTIK